MTELILIEILAVPAEQSRGRRNPRVVKRKMSNFPTKARAAPVARRIIRYDNQIRILTPAAPPRRGKPISDAGAFWLEHVRSWRRSDLPRTLYCQQHGLQPAAFNSWIARLRDNLRRPTKNAKTR
jgi:hypothetical protein